MKKLQNSLKLTENAKLVLNSRYLLKNREGIVTESPSELMERVARAISAPESNKKRSFWLDRFFEAMISRRFFPNSPTLMNAGKNEGQLSACFVLPIEDSLESIFDALKYAAKIHQSGGGTGFSFSKLRPKGSLVKSTQGVASGPVSFMHIFDVATETVKQGGVRRGANMAVLRVDHPDILEFIQVKADQKAMTNFNISVGITNEFMHAVKTNKSFDLRAPVQGRVVRSLSARELFNKMVRIAWECGDPGLVFLDQINRFNPTPSLGLIESTNPCGEQPLLPFESCNLGSLNLGEYCKERAFDWELFRQDIETAIRFLDNVVDANVYPVSECRRITLQNRKIGLGVMGFADLLLMMNLSYSSENARDLGERVMSFLDREAKRISAELAHEKGAFPNWKKSIWKQLGFSPLRNATVSTVAPTGTISMIAGASSGIEPLFSGIFYRNVLSGEKLIEIHPLIQKILEKKGLKMEDVNDEVISREIGPAWSPTRSVSVDIHVRMQAAFQRHSDSAVSKTINLPQEATEKEVAQAYFLAYELGCKGITVYRDQSRSAQVLEHAGEPGRATNQFECVDC